MVDIGKLESTLTVDTSQFEAEIDRMITKAEYLRSLLMRPWWVPYWVYRLLNGGFRG